MSKLPQPVQVTYPGGWVSVWFVTPSLLAKVLPKQMLDSVSLFAQLLRSCFHFGATEVTDLS